MHKKSYQQKKKSDLERRLELAERRLAHYEGQAAVFGDLYIPAHLQITIEKEKEKITQFKRQLSQIERNKPFYSAVQRFKTISRTIGDLIIPYDSASRRRRTKLIRKIQTNVLWFTLLIITIFSLGLYLNSQGVSISSFFPDSSATASSPVTSYMGVSENQPTLQSYQEAQVPQNSSFIPAVVANTRGVGVRFRLEPQQDAPSNFAISEGTTIFLIESISNGAGEIWWKVQLQDGQIGYVWERYILLK
jgi:hypothetical protein